MPAEAGYRYDPTFAVQSNGCGNQSARIASCDWFDAANLCGCVSENQFGATGLGQERRMCLSCGGTLTWHSPEGRRILEGPLVLGA